MNILRFIFVKEFVIFAKKKMEREGQYLNDYSTDTVVEENKYLLLINDDINTFDYVIETLVEVCDHTYEQAETCAWITHYKGKCIVKSGTFDYLEPFYVSLLNHHLYAKIQ